MTCMHAKRDISRSTRARQQPAARSQQPGASASRQPQSKMDKVMDVVGDEMRRPAPEPPTPPAQGAPAKDQKEHGKKQKEYARKLKDFCRLRVAVARAIAIAKPALDTQKCREWGVDPETPRTNQKLPETLTQQDGEQAAEYVLMRLRQPFFRDHQAVDWCRQARIKQDGKYKQMTDPLGVGKFGCVCLVCGPVQMMGGSTGSARGCIISGEPGPHVATELHQRNLQLAEGATAAASAGITQGMAAGERQGKLMGKRIREDEVREGRGEPITDMTLEGVTKVVDASRGAQRQRLVASNDACIRGAGRTVLFTGKGCSALPTGIVMRGSSRTTSFTGKGFKPMPTVFGTRDNSRTTKRQARAHC